MTTMNDMYKDGSDHTICLKCGFCHTCKDCKCKTPILEFLEDKKPKVYDNAKLKHKIPQPEKKQTCPLCKKTYWTVLSAKNCRCKKPEDRLKDRLIKPNKRDEKWKQLVQKV